MSSSEARTQLDEMMNGPYSFQAEISGYLARRQRHDTRNTIVDMLMRYLNAHVGHVRRLRGAVVEPGLWFAYIPRDITNMILEYIPNHYQDACSPFVELISHDIPIPRTIIPGVDEPPPMALSGYQGYSTFRRDGGVLHCVEYPAMIDRGARGENVYWYIDGRYPTNKPYERITQGNKIFYSWLKTAGRRRNIIDCTYEEECRSRNPMSYEDWEAEWRLCRDLDTFPLPDWYTGPR